MPVKNVRSPEQWEALSAVMDFNGKTVLDVGCGYGDLLLFAKDAGATVTGVDNNIEQAIATRKRGLLVACSDICQYLDQCRVYYDVAFCFSVLPYVDADAVLSKLARSADTTFIEAQLCGDGPGTFYNEEELRGTLLEHWDSVTRIGETKVEIRDTIRAIWMCERGKEMEAGTGVAA